MTTRTAPLLAGEFRFAVGGGQSVRLDDLTGEALADRVQIVFDAVRLRRIDAPARDAGGSDAGVRDSGMRDAGMSLPITDAGAAREDDADIPTVGPRPDVSPSCASAAGGRRAVPVTALWLLGLCAVGRRR